MDELKVSSKLMRAIVSKLISRTIKKKIGYKIKIQLSELEVKVIDERVYVHLNADAEMDSNELKKITRVVEAEEEEF